MDIFESSIVQPEEVLEYLIDRIEIDNTVRLNVTKFSSEDVEIGNIIPPTTYVENSVENQTRIRVFLNLSDFQVGEKVKVKLVK